MDDATPSATSLYTRVKKMPHGKAGEERRGEEGRGEERKGEGNRKAKRQGKRRREDHWIRIQNEKGTRTKRKRLRGWRPHPSPSSASRQE